MFTKGYSCGVIYSDGSIILDKKSGNYRISLETNEKEFTILFKKALAQTLNKKIKIYELDRKYKGEPYKTFQVSFYGKKRIKKFKNRFGLIIGSHNWVAPKLCFSNRDFRKGFLRGYFDGEGSIRAQKRNEGDNNRKRRNVRLTSANRCGLSELREMLEMEEIKSIIYPSGEYFRLDIEGKKRLSRFKKNIDFGLSRKKKKLRKAINL